MSSDGEPSSSPADRGSQAAARHDLEHRALAVLAIVTILLMAWVSKAVGVGIFLGALTAFTLLPTYDRLVRGTRRPWLAQLICMTIAVLAISVIVFGISGTLISRGSVLARGLLAELEPGGTLRAQLARMDRTLEPIGIDVSHYIDKLHETVRSMATYVTQIAPTVATKTMGGILTLFFLLLSTQFILARAHELRVSAVLVMPISEAHTRSLLHELRKVGRATLLGNVVTGLAQGLLAGGIFAVTSLPEPAFFGAATAVASLVPGVGTMLVWVPAGIFLIATGQISRGVLEIGLSLALVVGFCDYVLRPRLVGGDSMPALLTFAGLFGGVEAFGLIGLLVGPLLMALGVAVLRLYRAEQEGAQPAQAQAVTRGARPDR